MNKKVISLLLAVVLCFGFAVHIIGTDTNQVNAAESVIKNIGVDINGHEGRNPLKSPVFHDWRLGEYNTVTDPTFTYDGVTFKIPGTVKGDQNKTLIKTETQPYLTCDGLVLTDTIRLEISGLPAGKHNILTWHSYFKFDDKTYDAAKVGKIEIVINDKVTAKVTPTVKAATDEEAAMAYSEFEAKEGETVVILIRRAEGSTGYNDPVLNAFELDGVLPSLAISDPVPAENELHHDADLGLSWTAADNAVSHDLYLGTDEEVVNAATKSSKEYKGNLKGTSYEFEEELSHMKTYYWRVDEVDASGSVVKGKVMKFEIRHLAFPTAEGYGRFAKGGRGGRVIEVTTLEDNNEPGSLRYALEVEKGPRIVVFRVGGVIQLKSRLVIPNDGGNVYVAGQTAPGDGITLINYDFGALGAEDVIIRNVRVRVGDMNGNATGGMGLGSCNHSIVDHCSIAWSTDEGFSSREAYNITFQYNIIAEALHDSVHYNGTHAFAASISGDLGSFHHNLLTNCTGRNWSLAGAMNDDNVTYGGNVDISNNVVYNYTNRTTDGGVRRLNFVNNYYKMGASSRVMNIVSVDGDQLNTGDCQMMYVSGNKLVRNNGAVILDSDDDAWATGYAKAGNWGTEEKCRSDEPFFSNYITLESADDAYNTVLENAGAIVPERDYLDTRYIDEVKNGTYTYKGSKKGILGIIDSQNDVGGYPNSNNFKGGEAPADTDHDGMPDEWENKHGLNPNDSSDNSVISLSAEGYTNIEMYLNELMGDPLVWSDGTNTGNSTPIPTETATPAPTETVTPAPTETATPAPTETTAPTPTETAIPYTLGDVDSDGNINATDALLVLKHAAKIAELDEVGQLAADVTKEGDINANDALQILKYAAIIIDKF